MSRAFTGCKGRIIRDDDVVQVFQDLLSATVHGGAVCRDHVQLPRVNDEVAQDPQAFFHEGLRIPFQPGKRSIFPDLCPETVLIKDFSNELGPENPPPQVCRAALELEAYVILQGPVSHERFNRGEMEAEPGLQAAEIF